MTTINAKLLAKKTGIYSVYVFQNLDTLEYIMCTKLPNWEVNDIVIGSQGYLELDSVKEGETYYDRKEDKIKKYKYNQTYIKNFIPINKQTDLIIYD